MYEQQDNRDLDRKMMFQMQGIPTNQVNMSQLPKWIRYFGYFFLCLDRIIQYHRSFVLTFPMTFV